jgi:chitodextrinase
MNTWQSLRTFVCVAATLLFITANAMSFPPADKKAPTTPTNLHVTGTTSWSVSLAWNPSTDNSGFLTYRVQCNNGQSVVVPQSQTSVTLTAGLQHMGTYSFFVYAFDAAGNKSKNSNTVTATLPQDTVAPVAPVISLVNVGPTHAVLSWSSADIGPLIYAVYRDGALLNQPSSATSATAYLLQPETSYTFTAKARDNAGNWSPLSAPFVVTTPAADPNDLTPPSVPTNIGPGTYSDGSTEFTLTWSPSTDSVTPQQFIVYKLYVNGVWVGLTVGTTQTNEYGEIGENIIELTATDEAGNESEPAIVILTLPQ